MKTSGFPDFVAGDNVDVDLSFTDHTGAALDVTGYTLDVTFKSSLGLSDANANLAKSYSPSGTTYTLSLTAADTSGLSAGAYYVEIRLKDASGNVTTALQETVTVSQPVLQAP